MKNLIVLFLLAFVSCSLLDGPNEVNNASKLPLLKNQNNIGGILGFNPSYPDKVMDSFDIAWNELLDAGMSIGRLQIDWQELEPSQGNYEKGILERALIDLREDGLQPFLTFSVYDSGGPELPGYLEGEKLDSDVLLARFESIMDWVIPMLASYDGWGIAIANEPDNAFEDDKQLDDEIIAYTISARDYIHSLNEDMAVSVTMNIENYKKARRPMRNLLKECDFLALNLYGGGVKIGEELQPFDESADTRNFEEMFDLANGKQIVIQELGMFTENKILNSSEEIQKKFFEDFFKLMEREDQIRAAVQFTLVDWSDDVLEIWNEEYEDGVPQWFIDQYGSVLKTLGLIAFDSGSKRPAFDEFVKWCRIFDE